MTESGYRFANWLCEKKDNVLVAVAYLTLAVVIMVAAGISLQSPPPDSELQQRITADDDYHSRRPPVR